MAILVTGAAGFLGRHLVKVLLDGGHDGVGVDSLWTGYMSNLEEFEKHPKFRFIRCDVRDLLSTDEDLDEIYHLACPASPDQFETHAMDILDTCYVGTRNVLELAVKHKARFLLASTSEVYGDPTVPIQPETYFGNANCFGPRSCYDEGKRVAEALTFAYQARHDLSVRVARIFNSYGPYMDINDGRAVPNFIGAAMEGQPIKIYGDGSATRCFQYVSDCIDGLVKLMQKEYTLPVNIGSDVEIEVGEIAKMAVKVVARRLGRTEEEEGGRVEFLPKRKDDPAKRRPETKVAREELG